MCAWAMPNRRSNPRKHQRLPCPAARCRPRAPTFPDAAGSPNVKSAGSGCVTNSSDRSHSMRRFLSFLAACFSLGVVNTSTSDNLQADVVAYIQDEVEPLARRQLVAYQFGRPLHLDVNRGTTYTATRYERLNLPFAQLQEGVAPAGEGVNIAQVSATAQQWGDRVIVTDVANITIFHPVFQQAVQLVSLQMPET